MKNEPLQHPQDTKQEKKSYQSVDCPTCHASKGVPCQDLRDNAPRRSHIARRERQPIR